MKCLRILSMLVFAWFAITAGANGFWKVAAEEVPGTPVSRAVQDAAQSNPESANVAGKWNLSWKGKKRKPHQAALEIQQDGTKLTGTFEGEGRGGLSGSLALTGSVQGNNVSFTVQSQENNKSGIFTGTVDGGTMNGTTREGHPWTATRQQE